MLLARTFFFPIVVQRSDSDNSIIIGIHSKLHSANK